MKLTEKNAQYAVVKTAFHNGGTISFHNSLEAAKNAALKFQSAGCSCGCADVVPVTESAQKTLTEYEVPALYSNLPEWGACGISPYQLCR